MRLNDQIRDGFSGQIKVCIGLFLMMMGCGWILAAPLQASQTSSVKLEADQWRSFNQVASITRTQGTLKGRIIGTDPYIISSAFETPVQADEVKEIVIRMRNTFGQQGQIFWAATDHAGFEAGRHLNFSLHQDQDWHEYRLNVAGHPQWKGQINRIRLDPVADAQSLDYFEVAYVKLVAKGAADEARSAHATQHLAVRTALTLVDRDPADAPAPGSMFTPAGALIVEGQAIFPFGTGDLPAVDDPFAEMRDGGLHFAIFNGLSDALIETLRAHDLKALLAPMPLYYEKSTREKRIEDSRNAYFDRYDRYADTIIAFYAADEPVWVETPLSVMLDAYQYLSSLTPRRPVFMCEAPRNTVETIRPYAPAADILGVDIYPVPEGNGHSDLPNQTISVVGDYTDKAHEVSGRTKPVWMYLQAYGRGAEHTIPTWHQTRFMAYNAILHDARGLVYYGLRHMDWPNDMWPQLQRLGREVRTINAVLAAPWASEFDPVALKAGIELRHKRVDGQYYLFVINTTAADRTLEWTMTNSAIAQLHVLFENGRTIQADGQGVWRDTLKPYDVRVYATVAVEPWQATKPMASEARHTPANMVPVAETPGQWIWGPGLQKVDDVTVYFRRVVHVGQVPAHAPVLITADNGYRLYCNGKLVGADWHGEQGGWFLAEQYDLAPYLIANSRNVIAVEVVNETSWAGLFIQGKVGEAEVHSSSRWRTATEVAQGWHTSSTYEDSGWRLAETFGKPPVEPWRHFLVPSEE